MSATHTKRILPGAWVLTPSHRIATVVRVDLEQRSAPIRWRGGELAELRESHLRPGDPHIDLEVDCDDSDPMAEARGDAQRDRTSAAPTRPRGEVSTFEEAIPLDRTCPHSPKKFAPQLFKSEGPPEWLA